MKIYKFITFFLFLIFAIQLNSSEIKNHHKNKKKSLPISKKIIILSIDGFPADYLEDNALLERIPNLRNFFELSQGGRIKTVNPSITYPSHTSMLTGKNPADHGIEGNSPIDPFNFEDGTWFWYYEDIKTQSLLDIAKKHKAKLANVYWPVTVGANIDWNIPQYWRNKTPWDKKILRVLSTNHLHKEMEDAIGEPVLETSSDLVKIQSGIKIFEKYKPDLMLIYTTDLDSIQHAKGANSTESISMLSTIDQAFGELIRKINLYNRKDIGMIVVSDHGFNTSSKICKPNFYLRQKNFINPEEKKWKYYIKSSGGFAYLVSNPSQEDIKPIISSLDFKEFKEEIVKNCPNVRIVDKGKEWEDYKSKSHPDAILFLLSDESTYISSSWEGNTMSVIMKLHSHGYDAKLSSMDAIGFFYNPLYKNSSNSKKHLNKTLPFQNVKDIFPITCKWMEWNCKPRK